MNYYVLFTEHTDEVCTSKIAMNKFKYEFVGVCIWACIYMCMYNIVGKGLKGFLVDILRMHKRHLKIYLAFWCRWLWHIVGNVIDILDHELRLDGVLL